MFGFSWPNPGGTSSPSKNWFGNEIRDTKRTFYLIEEVIDANGCVDDRVSILGDDPPPIIKPIRRIPDRDFSKEQLAALSKFFSGR